MNAPQNSFGLDGPADLWPDVGFELWSLILYFMMLSVLIMKLKMESLPANISVAAFGAWAGTSSFCAIGLISTLGFADGSEARVFAAATLFSVALIVVSGIYAGLAAMRNKQKQNYG